MRPLSCECCVASRETNGKYRSFDPACLWCGARYLQHVQRIAHITVPAKVEWLRGVLARWTAWGHEEQALRSLMKEPAAALEPLQAPPPKTTKAKAAK